MLKTLFKAIIRYWAKKVSISPWQRSNNICPSYTGMISYYSMHQYILTWSMIKCITSEQKRITKYWNNQMHLYKSKRWLRNADALICFAVQFYWEKSTTYNLNETWNVAIFSSCTSANIIKQDVIEYVASSWLDLNINSFLECIPKSVA